MTGMFSSRGYNIDTLNVAPTDDPTVSRVTIVVSGSDAAIEQLNSQLAKLVDVVNIHDMTLGEHFERELAIVKLKLSGGELARAIELAGGQLGDVRLQRLEATEVLPDGTVQGTMFVALVPADGMGSGAMVVLRRDEIRLDPLGPTEAPFTNVPTCPLSRLAAIFAAAMSSIDSVLNSLSGATVVDIYRRWINPDADDRQSLRVGKFITLFWGVVATFFALFFAGGGSIIEMINRVGSWFYGSLLGIFLLALFMPRAGGIAGSCGLIGGMLSVLIVHNVFKVQFLWYNVVGCLGVLLVGLVVATFHKPELE